MPAEVDLTLSLPGLSPVCGKPVVARFDGGRLSSNGGILLDIDDAEDLYVLGANGTGKSSLVSRLFNENR